MAALPEPKPNETKRLKKFQDKIDNEQVKAAIGKVLDNKDPTLWVSVVDELLKVLLQALPLTLDLRLMVQRKLGVVKRTR